MADYGIFTVRVFPCEHCKETGKQWDIRNGHLEITEKTCTFCKGKGFGERRHKLTSAVLWDILRQDDEILKRIAREVTWRG